MPHPAHTPSVHHADGLYEHDDEQGSCVGLCVERIGSG